MRRIARNRAAAAALLAAAGAAPAQQGLSPAASGLNQSVWIQLQAYRPSIRSAGRLDDASNGLQGTQFNFEDELGLARRKTLGALLIGARFGGNWRAEFEYYALDRSSARTLSTSITVDDTVFPVSATVYSEFDSKVYRASLGYSFYRTDATEAGVAFGLHVTDFKVALEGIGAVAGTTVAATRREEREKTVPLPTLGLYATTALNAHWMLAGRADALYLKLHETRGTLVNLSANVLYRFTPNVGVGLGWRYVDYTLERTASDQRGRVDYRFSGPQAFLDLGF